MCAHRHTNQVDPIVVLEIDASVPRRDSVDRCWELIQPVLQVWEATPGVELYDKGSPGPASADAMIKRYGHSWRPLCPQ